VTPLTGWLQSVRSHHGVYFADESDGWTFYSYAEIARRVLGIAARLRDAGVRNNDVVCLVLPTGPDFVSALFGVWSAGATACPMAPPGVFAAPGRFLGHTQEILATAEPAAVVTSKAFTDLVRTAMDRADAHGHLMAAEEADGYEANSAGMAALAQDATAGDLQARTALLQFTSGSTGSPRGVRISTENLVSNVSLIRTWLGWGPDDVAASWLPLHHDMGLIGCLITPVVTQTDVWLMRPDQFLRDPARWLARFGHGQATLTATPSFGLAYAARRTEPADLAGMDFSRWRSAIVAAEPIDVRALRGFADLLAPQGFRLETFRPAYGLAEATLAVTGTERIRAPRLVRPDWEMMRFGEPVKIETESPLDGVALGDRPTGWLVGCGRALAGTRVTVHGADGASLPEGALGEIVVRGPGVAGGYQGGDPVGSTRIAEDRLVSGDAGFLLDGELFVVGRIADGLKVRGRSVYVEDLEVRAVSAGGISKGRCAVVSSPGPGQGEIVVLIEAQPGPWAERIVRALRTELGTGPKIRVVAGGPGLIRRGTSGKPRRRHMWEEFQSGRLGGQLLLEEPADTTGNHHR
jgi:fatty-acyl-CoA synthase